MLNLDKSTTHRSAAFLDWLDRWYQDLRPVSLRDRVIPEAGGADRVAVVVVDLLVGFCSEGALASPRVGALGPRAARFLEQAWSAGIHDILIARDSHPE